ncbi:MAG TPA: GNAT family N-acetyltransferase [Polyangiaceae bacterium]|nr:GNAT family N-acetyltransferase [Polyangiaceae bacterium]
MERDTAVPEVMLDPIAKDQAPVLRNLLELYAHDFSEHVPLDLQADGRFDVDLGDQWWTDAGHFPFFIRWRGKVSGFALVRRGSRLTDASDVMDVAEFFVLRGARGRKVGSTAAHAIFAAFPGRWEIRVRRSNLSARKFWARVVETWLDRPAASVSVSSGGIDWDVFRVD